MAEEEEGAGAGDRTEAATPRRLEKAREQGQVALSREAAGWAALGLATLAAFLVLPAVGPEMLRAFRGALEQSHALGLEEAAPPLLRLFLLMVVPVAGAAALGAIAATLGQSRGLVSATPLAPSLAKISPWAGLKRLLGAEAAAEMLRSLLKLLLVGAALWHALADLSPLRDSLHHPPAAMLHAAGDVSLRLMVAALVAFAAVALLDVMWVRFRHARMLRMSRQDLREEAKESEGDPTLRARRRQLREKVGRQRMLAAVPKAAVVITNPTHYAVALSYEGGEAAPQVVAKGMDAVAARIRAAAEAAGVPLVSNPPLARALHRLEVGDEIPAEHYQAVAEIIAFVWRRTPGRVRP
jgi:flagellar biosynthetic protein FlhB